MVRQAMEIQAMDTVYLDVGVQFNVNQSTVQVLITIAIWFVRDLWFTLTHAGVLRAHVRTKLKLEVLGEQGGSSRPTSSSRGEQGRSPVTARSFEQSPTSVLFELQPLS